MTDALGTQVWIDLVNLNALKDRLVRAFRLADVAVDALVGDLQGHGRILPSMGNFGFLEELRIVAMHLNLPFFRCFTALRFGFETSACALACGLRCPAFSPLSPWGEGRPSHGAAKRGCGLGVWAPAGHILLGALRPFPLHRCALRVAGVG